MRGARARGAALAVLGLAVSGCAATEKLSSGLDTGGSALANLLAFNTTTPGPAPAATKVDTPLQCPIIEVLDGTASYRTYIGTDQSNGNVRYQFSMGDIARDCTKVGNQILVKVGVEGRVLLGPAGAPGAFTVPVRIAVRREFDGKPVATKLYQAPASIAGGGDSTTFQVITDPIAVPFVSNQADGDYTILVGFDAGTKASPAAAGGKAGRAGRRKPTAPADATPGPASQG